MRPFTLMPGMNQTAVFWMQRSSLLYLSKMRRNMKKRSACSGKMLHGQFISTIIRAHGSGS